VRASYGDASGTAVIVTTHPAGGVLGGDRLDVGVELAEDARATILDQGATQAYRGFPACRRTVLRVADGAVPEHLPHHVIPFAGSSLALDTRVELGATSTLLAWEAIAGPVLASASAPVEGVCVVRILCDQAPELYESLGVRAGWRDACSGWPRRRRSDEGSWLTRDGAGPGSHEDGHSVRSGAVACDT